MPRPAAARCSCACAPPALNAGDVQVMRGEPLLVRPAFGLRRPQQRDAGDGCRRHRRRGRRRASTAFAVGDEVMGELPGGSGSPSTPSRPRSGSSARPAGSRPRDRGGPAASPAARRGRHSTRRRRHRGQRVLVIGASGGVGTFAVQLAALRGAEVWALCGARSRGARRGLGAVRTFDYTHVSGCGRPARRRPSTPSSTSPAPPRCATCARCSRATAAARARLGRGRTRARAARPDPSRGIRLARSPGPRIRPLAAVGEAPRSRASSPRSPRPALRPVIERTWPLAEAGAALAHVDAGHTVGKVVVTPTRRRLTAARADRERMDAACPSRPLHTRFLSERSESKRRRAPGQRPPPLPEGAQMSTQNTAPAADRHRDRRPSPASSSTARYLMCRPEHFTVSYTINPWMEPANPTDTALAVAAVAGAVRHVHRARPRRAPHRPHRGPARHGLHGQRRLPHRRRRVRREVPLPGARARGPGVHGVVPRERLRRRRPRRGQRGRGRLPARRRHDPRRHRLPLDRRQPPGARARCSARRS